MELFFLATTFSIMYFTARLFCKKLEAFIVTLVSASLLFMYYEGGNLSEEYAMAFIAIGLYIFIDYFINSRISKCRLIICGFVFAGTLMLRPNMVALWVVMCVAVLLLLLQKKLWKNIFDFILFFMIGAMLLIVPIIVWLASNGALIQCWQDYIVFNGEYMSAGTPEAILNNRWDCFFYFFSTDIYIAVFLIQVYLCKMEKSVFHFAYLLYMLIVLLFICLSRTAFGHYGMILVPMVVYPLARVFSMLERIDNKFLSEVLVLLCSVYMLSSFVIPNWIELARKVPEIYETRDESHISGTVLNISDMLDELNIGKEEPISVYGNLDLIYLASQRPHATRYSYQFPVGQVSPRIMDEYFESLKVELPQAIVVQFYDDAIKNFLEENDYKFVWGENGEAEADGLLIFYRRKDS